VVIMVRPSCGQSRPTYRPPGGWLPLGRICCFQLLLVVLFLNMFCLTMALAFSSEISLDSVFRCCPDLEELYLRLHLKPKPLFKPLVKLRVLQLHRDDAAQNFWIGPQDEAPRSLGWSLLQLPQLKCLDVDVWDLPWAIPSDSNSDFLFGKVGSLIRQMNVE
jgi:hypothetical protein